MDETQRNGAAMLKDIQPNVLSEMAAIGGDREGFPVGAEAFGLAPQWDYLLVRQPERAERTNQGGVIVMPTVGFAKNDAEVVAVGPGILHDGKRVPMPFAPGDRVILAVAQYHLVHVDGEDLLIVKAGLVMAKVTKADAVLLNVHGKKDYAAAYSAAHSDDD